ncbi:MAG: hydrogenase maturation protease [Candidatus Sumerlaeaceae bacterium]|nr:hydrogenase maturation protease [Candidatus Sumerlaeaceae bacterium]
MDYESGMPLIVGIGNEFRRDDGVGLEIVRKLRPLVPQAEVQEASGEGAELVELLSEHNAVYLFDAVSSGAAPGTIYRIDSHKEPVPTKFFHYSTHDFSLAEAIELTRALGSLPRVLVVYGIEGADFDPGVGLSEVVSYAVDDVIKQCLAELATVS